MLGALHASIQQQINVSIQEQMKEQQKQIQALQEQIPELQRSQQSDMQKVVEHIDKILRTVTDASITFHTETVPENIQLGAATGGRRYFNAY